MVNMQQAQG
jgi:hypothetical protein